MPNRSQSPGGGVTEDTADIFEAPQQTLFLARPAHRVLLMVSVLELTTLPSTISSTMVMICLVVVEEVEVEVVEVVEMLKEQEAETRA